MEIAGAPGRVEPRVLEGAPDRLGLSIMLERLRELPQDVVMETRRPSRPAPATSGPRSAPAGRRPGAHARCLRRTGPTRRRRGRARTRPAPPSPRRRHRRAASIERRALRRGRLLVAEIAVGMGQPEVITAGQRRSPQPVQEIPLSPRKSSSVSEKRARGRSDSASCRISSMRRRSASGSGRRCAVREGLPQGLRGLGVGVPAGRLSAKRTR